MRFSTCIYFTYSRKLHGKFKNVSSTPIDIASYSLNSYQTIKTKLDKEKNIYKLLHNCFSNNHHKLCGKTCGIKTHMLMFANFKIEEDSFLLIPSAYLQNFSRNPPTWFSYKHLRQDILRASQMFAAS